MKICIITGSRAEFDLLKNLITKMSRDKFFNIKLIVTGAHLKKFFGKTLNYIKGQKLKINKIVDLSIKGDNVSSISNSFSTGIKKFSSVLYEIKPDAIMILGDRYEIFSSAISACLNRIPIIHLHGGERTEGLIDEAIRHSITKLSHIHLVSTEIYKKRVIQLGENKKHVYNVGSLGVESIKKTKFLNKFEIEKKLQIKLKKKIALVCYHPETLSNTGSIANLKKFFKAISKLKDFTIIFTMPNADIGYKNIVREINKFIKKNHNSYLIKSLGHQMYFSLCNYASLMIGNTSSGIIEFPTFKKPTINIGKRQDGRIKPKSVIDSSHNISTLLNKISLSSKESFKMKIKKLKNPYYQPNTSLNIIKILKKIKLKNIIFKKFIDIK
jgi:GDP/UDP-N,N'-diacetylbacillosamine 2-epimerase (hydrolysing)